MLHLCIHSVLATVIRNASARQTKTVRFLQVAFDTTGESFLAGDHHGNIYVFDISRNRYRKFHVPFHKCSFLLIDNNTYFTVISYCTSSIDRFKLVQRTSQACTALAFNLRRTTEFLVALADYSIKCFDKGKFFFTVLV